MMHSDGVYLGDGVYASWDGYHIWLDLRAQDPAVRIALEPPVMRALIAYKDRIDQMARGEQPPQPDGQH